MASRSSNASRATAERGADARAKLVDAACELFAERGVEGVSLRELTRAAGQANTSALQYHFGDREGLLDAVLAPYQTRVDARRAMLIEEIEARTTASLRDIASALVRPSAAMLEEAGGKAYLRIVAELCQDPRRFSGTAALDHLGLRDWTHLARDHMPEAVSPLHRRFAAAQLCFSELGRRASTRRRSDHRLFVSDLIDLTTAILDAPVSSETERLLEERDSENAAERGQSR